MKKHKPTTSARRTKTRTTNKYIVDQQAAELHLITNQFKQSCWEIEELKQELALLKKQNSFVEQYTKYKRLQFHFSRLQEQHNSLVKQHSELAIATYKLRRRLTSPLNRMPEETEIYRGALAGVQFTQYQTAENLGLISTACKLELVPEPDNPHDDKAIGVWVPSTADAGTKIRIGYIKRVDNAIIHAFLERGITLTTYLHLWDQEAKPWNRYTIRVTAPNIVNKS